jgi:hypothetical protein
MRPTLHEALHRRKHKEVHMSELSDIAAHYPVYNLYSLCMKSSKGTIEFYLFEDGSLSIAQVDHDGGDHVVLSSHEEFQQFEAALFQMGLAMEAAEAAKAQPKVGRMLEGDGYTETNTGQCTDAGCACGSIKDEL